MRPSQSNIRTPPSEDGPARDSRSFARQAYDDDAHIQDSRSNTRLYTANDEVPKDSRSTTRRFDDGGVRDRQSFTRVGDYSREGVKLDQEAATGGVEDILDGSASDLTAPGMANAEELDKDHWKYTFREPLPQLEQENAQASNSWPLRICLQSCELLTLDAWRWNGRMEINGVWNSAPDNREEYHPQAFKLIYSYRQWQSAEVHRLISESSDHSLDLVKALRLTLSGKGSEDEFPFSHWVEKHCHPHDGQLSRPFGDLAGFLGRAQLEDGEGTAEEYCIGEYKLPNKKKALSREDVLRERTVEGVSREDKGKDRLLL